MFLVDFLEEKRELSLLSFNANITTIHPETNIRG
jgi:hypothetical protein